MGNIVVVGSANTDLTVQVPQLPGPGETVLGSDFHQAAGGKGANQAVAAARAGGSVSFVGCVGEDAFGRQALQDLGKEDIDTEHVFTAKGVPTGVALITVDETGENSIAVAAGANAELTPERLARAQATLAAADVLLVQLEVPLETVEAAVRAASEHGAAVVLDPAPAQPLGRALLERVSVLTPNAAEAEQLAGARVDREAGPQALAATLHAQGAGGVIVTQGTSGAFVAGGIEGRQEQVPGRNVEATDATAAGDVFSGTLAVALAEGRPLSEAARFANAAAALSVTVRGAQPSVPHREAIETALKVHA